MVLEMKTQVISLQGTMNQICKLLQLKIKLQGNKKIGDM